MIWVVVGVGECPPFPCTIRTRIGQVKFYPYGKERGVAMLKGCRGRKSVGVVFPQKLEVLAILKGEAQKFRTRDFPIL